MLKQLKKREQGFTIIEVLIVLAIAGLIMLIVFLAVPALQRNSRNTQRRNDVGRVLGAVNEYVSNNNGTLPASSCSDKTGGSACAFLNNVDTGYYKDYSKISYTVQASATAPAAVTDPDTVKVYNYATCVNNAPSVTGATARSVIALFAVETGGSTQAQCSAS